MTWIYKILERASWEEALARGTFTGSPVDAADGYIHFSTARQAPETARRYFSGVSDAPQPALVLLTVDAAALGPALKWEPARGGDLFPHLYGPLAVGLVSEVRHLTRDEAGAPRLGTLEP